MNEARALLAAFDAAVLRGERCALATVVGVEGSAYRKAGARMLITEKGTSTGTISAGCLERDVIEHARRVMRLQAPKIVEFDTRSSSDETAWGLGLGCNGIVRVLVEPAAPTSLCMEALRSATALSADASGGVVVATVLGATPGARVVVDTDGSLQHEHLTDAVAAQLGAAVLRCMQGPTAGERCTAWVDGKPVELFVETLLPPLPLLIFGAGPDVLPIVELARGLGWHTEVVDPQARTASRDRFAPADKVTLARPHEVAGCITVSPRTFALLMSHNYVDDVALLRFLLSSPARYIGVMGPRSRTDRVLEELGASERTDLARLHAPVGLDIGADGPREIALSILAEIRAVAEGRRGGMLRDRVRAPVIADGSSQAHPAIGL